MAFNIVADAARHGWRQAATTGFGRRGHHQIP
jgi:phage gp16-like protein